MTSSLAQARALYKQMQSLLETPDTQAPLGQLFGDLKMHLAAASPAGDIDYALLDISGRHNGQVMEQKVKLLATKLYNHQLHDLATKMHELDAASEMQPHYNALRAEAALHSRSIPEARAVHTPRFEQKSWAIPAPAPTQSYAEKVTLEAIEKNLERNPN